MTARTKRLFSASQPAGNWEAFFGHLITSTKEVMGLVWFGCTKKKGICMNIFYQRCSRSGSGSRNFWKDSSPWWNWVQRCTDLAVSLQSHVRLKRKKQLWFDVLKKIWLLDPGNLFTRGLEGMLSSFNCWFLFINCYTLFIWKSPKLYITNIKWVNI